MDSLDLIVKEVKEMQGRLNCCLYKMVTSPNIWERMYYENLVYQDTFRLKRMLEEVKQVLQENANNDDNTLPIFTLGERAYEVFLETLEREFILVVEGAVSKERDNKYPWLSSASRVDYRNHCSLN